MGKITVKNENYYVVHGWMRNELGLKGNALDIYAIIYGFSQTDHQEFTASVNYLCDWLGASRPTVINTLKSLVDRGLLTKESDEINGVIYNRYRAVKKEDVSDFTGGKNFLPGGKEILRGSKKILPNKENNKENNKEKALSTKEGDKPPVKKKSYKSYGEIFCDPKYDDIRDQLERYIRNMLGMNYTPRVSTVEKWAEFLLQESHGNILIATKIVDQSISKGWKSLYPLKDQQQVAVSEPYNPDDLARDDSGKYIVY